MKKKRNPRPDRTTAKERRVAVIWTRVSTKEQAEHNLSLETQEKACQDYAKRLGIEVVRIMGQTNESAKTEGKLYREMIAYVSSNRQINTILVYSFDRFSRAGAEAMMTKAYLKAKGISVISVTQPIDDDNVAGEFMQNLIFLFNQFENNLRKDKCTAGMLASLERGDWYSKPPRGYSIDHSAPKKHAFVINDEGRLIAKAFEWKAEGGITDVEIQERLRTRGLDLSNKRLGEIFRNPFYCGRISHSLLGDRIVKGNHPQIVSEEVFDRINGTYHTEDRYIQQEETPEYPLRKFIKCSECGFFLTGYEVKKKGLHYYKCNTKGCRCNISAKKLHEQFIDLLKQYTLPEEILPIVREIMLNVLRERSEENAQRMQELKALKKANRQQFEDVTVRFGLGSIGEEVYNITSKHLEGQLAQIEDEITALQNQNSNRESLVDDILSTACHLDTLWQQGDYRIKQRLQKLVFPNGLIYDRATSAPRTVSEHPAFAAFRSISNEYRTTYNAKAENSVEFSAFVVPTGIEPVFKV